MGILWGYLIKNLGMKIHFAHRTFKWSNEAKGKAAVHVVIIGFGQYDINEKRLYFYDHIAGDPELTIVKNINPYLVSARDVILDSISNPICLVPRMQSGSAARDGGFLIFTDAEYQEFSKKHQNIAHYFKRLISGDDFINNIIRWCLWLKDMDISFISRLPEIKDRLQKCKDFRLKSTREGTKRMAEYPYLFAEERQPVGKFILIPKVSSENRRYIPIAFLDENYIITDKTFVVPKASFYNLGVLLSLMHMTWTKNTCGRLKSDISYSNTIVYNNFPWPESPTEKQKAQIEQAAQAVLDARTQFPESSLADLYDPLTMPPVLLKAHQELDKAVDLAYRPQPFPSEAKRMEFLFELYEKYTAGLFGEEKKPKKKKSAKA